MDGATPAASGGDHLGPNRGLRRGLHLAFAASVAASSLLMATIGAGSVLADAPLSVTIGNPASAVTGETVPIDVTILVDDGDPLPTGTVTLMFNGVPQTSPVVPGLGSSARAGFFVTFPHVGNYGIAASYSGDVNTDPAIAPDVWVPVGKASTTTSVTMTPVESDYFENVIFDVTALAVAPGSGTVSGGAVQIWDGSQRICGLLIGPDGTGACSTKYLGAGDHTITAVFAGNDDYEGSTSAGVLHTVDPLPTTTSLTVAPNPADPGGSMTYSITVDVPEGSPPELTAYGSVTVYDGSTPLCTTYVPSRVATCTGPAPFPGSHSLTAVYAGVSGLLTSTSAAVSLTVNHAHPAIALVVTPEPSSYGDFATFTATVSSAGAPRVPTGVVVFKVDGVEVCAPWVDGSGVANCPWSEMAIGAHTISAEYQGDTFFAPVSTTAQHTVGRATTTTTVVAHGPNPSLVGQTVSVTFNVAAPGIGDPTGSVTVTGAPGSPCVATIVDGSATCDFTFDDAATYELTATYNGDTTFAPSSTTYTQDVVGLVAFAQVGLHQPNPSVVGQPIDVEFTVTPIPFADAKLGAAGPAAMPDPTGTVTVWMGTSSCTADVSAGSCTVTPTEAGNLEVYAEYSGDSVYTGLPFPFFDLHVVQPASTRTTIASVTPEPSTPGGTVTAAFTVVPIAPGGGNPTGSVTVSGGGQSCTATIAVGHCTLTFPAVGTVGLTASYAGDGNYRASTSTAVSHVVEPAPMPTPSPTATPTTSPSATPTATPTAAPSQTAARSESAAASATARVTPPVTGTSPRDPGHGSPIPGFAALFLAVAGVAGLLAAFAQKRRWEVFRK